MGRTDRSLHATVLTVRVLISAFVAVAVNSLAYGESLLDAYQAALKHDATLASARAANTAAQEKAIQGRALLLPTAGLSANGARNWTDISSQSAFIPSGTRNYNSRGVVLSLAQPLFRKQNWAQYGQSKLVVEQANIELGRAQQDLILRLAQAYFDILLAQDRVVFVGAQKTAISEQLAQAKRSFEVGTATITDTHESQARFDLAAADEIGAQNDVESRRKALEILTGRAPTALAPLRQSPPLKAPEPNDLAKWVRAAQEQNLLVDSRKIGAEIAALDVDRARGEHYPTVDLVGSYSDQYAGSSTFTAGSITTRGAALGVQMNLPLYAGGAIQSRVRESASNAEKARFDLEDARRQATLQTQQSFLAVTSGLSRVKALEQAVVSAETAVRSNRIGFEVGVRTTLDLLDAQQQLYNARYSLAQARYEYLLNQLRLKAGVGTLNVDDVAALDQMLARGPQ